MMTTKISMTPRLWLGIFVFFFVVIAAFDRLPNAAVIVSGFDLKSLSGMNRREALATAAASFVGLASAGSTTARATNEIDDSNKATSSSSSSSSSSSFQAYSIVPDATTALNPNLVPIKRSPLLKKLATIDNLNGGALWLGEHHNSFQDHTLQRDLIESIHQERMVAAAARTTTKSKQNNIAPMAIGLEQVQVQFQPVLDSFVAGRISLDDLKFHVQWEKRWFWDFNGYAPIFELARNLQIPLIALNVNSEDFAEVQQGGLAALAPKRLRRYIKDPQGFAAFALQNEFKDYVDYVIAPSYDMHQRMGLLKTTMAGGQLDQDISYRNFLTGRMLWDESMASIAHSWVQDNPGGLLVGLVGADHVKFEDGIPGRFRRLGGGWAESDQARRMSSTSVLLNPTLIDTRPAGTVLGLAESDSSHHPERLALQLRYVKPGVTRTDVEARRLPENMGGVLPLADYIVLS